MVWKWVLLDTTGACYTSLELNQMQEDAGSIRPRASTLTPCPLPNLSTAGKAIGAELCALTFFDFVCLVPLTVSLLLQARPSAPSLRR